MSKKKHKQPFDSKGGVVVVPRRMVESNCYTTLAPQSKVLMILMQLHWRAYDYIDYGIREAMEKIPCSDKSATKAFNQLMERGFISCMEQSFFSSRTQSKTRSWRLEWMPFNDKPPRNTWENWADEN